jgi:hypothetical protein
MQQLFDAQREPAAFLRTLTKLPAHSWNSAGRSQGQASGPRPDGLVEMRRIAAFGE